MLDGTIKEDQYKDPRVGNTVVTLDTSTTRSTGY